MIRLPNHNEQQTRTALSDSGIWDSHGEKHKHPTWVVPGLDVQHLKLVYNT